MSNTNSAAHGAPTPGGPTGSEVRQLMKSVPQTPKRAVLYTRVSGHEQVKGFSLRQQLDALRAYCDREGIAVVGVFEDPGVSGSLLERPGLDALRDRVAEGGVDLVLAQDLDRISRMEAWRYQYLKAWFADHGARVRYLEGSDDDETPMGKFIAQIRHAHAELERDDIRRRMTRGRLQRAREGNVIGSGSPPFGFAYNADRTNYVVDDAAMSLVRRIFGLFAERNSVRRVKAILEEDGTKTPTGGSRWSRQTLRQMVLADVYKPHTFEDLRELARNGHITDRVLTSLDKDTVYGVWWYNVKRRDRHAKKLSTRPDAERIAVPVPDAGLDANLVETARRTISGNVKSSRAGHREHWELLGHARCVCGEKLGSQSNKRKSGAYAHYYVCTRKRNGKGECEHMRYHRAERLEKRIRAFARWLLRKPEIIVEQTESYIESERNKRSRDPAAEEAALRSALEKLDKKRARYLEQHAEELITTDDLKARLAEVEKQRASLDSQLAILKDSERHFADLEKLAHDFVLDLPDLLKDLDNLNENAAADVYEDVYERLNLRAVVDKDGRIDVYFGTGGEAHITVSDLDNVPPRPPLPPPDDPVWDTWREGDPIPEPTGKSVVEIVRDNW